MTGRTHDLTAFAALSYVAAQQPQFSLSLATLMVAVGANLIGGLTPDIDQPTADLWRRLPAGSVIGRIITPLLGSHRYISHSFLGIAVFGWVAKFLLQKMGGILLVDMNIVWTAFMIGFISHIVIDMLTQEGVPWLFPIPIRFGLPPLKILRLKTGGVAERTLIFPGLLLFTGYIYYANYHKFLDLLKYYVK